MVTKEASRRGFTKISVDWPTLARLKEIACGKPLSSFLRELSLNLSRAQEEKDRRISALWRASQPAIVKNADDIFSLDMSKRPLGMLDYELIRQAIERDPYTLHAGWYDFIDGEWVFDERGHNSWFGEYATLRDQGLSDREAGYIVDQNHPELGKTIGLGNIEYRRLRDLGHTHAEAEDILGGKRRRR